MKLYDLELSGNCYKIRLFLSLIEKSYELVPVDFLAGEHKKPPLSDINPFGEIPILKDGDLVLRDSQAILVYLARQYASEEWLPTDAAAMADVMQWLMVAENEVARGPNDARLHDKFGYQLDHQLAVDKSTRILDLIDLHLNEHEWLALERPTIADIACFPYIALGHEGGAGIGDRQHIVNWCNRIKALPNFISMPDLA
ncbi:MAG: glutathione S-transferase family protein [Pseudomonadota bacterium]